MCFFSSFSAQETFLQKNLYTLWERDGEELNFLESCDISQSFGGVEDPESFTFVAKYETISDSSSLAYLTSLECCMCSYKIITKNTRDTLRLEYGGRGDFGPASVATRTFFLEGQYLVQLVDRDDGTAVAKHIWEPSPSRALPEDLISDKTQYSHSWAPLNLRSQADLESEILGKIRWGESVEVLEKGLEKVVLGLNFAETFESAELEYREHRLVGSFAKVLYQGIPGYVYQGFLGKRKPFDFASFFDNTTTPAYGMEFPVLKRSDSELIWEQKIELGQRDEGVAYKNFIGYADGVVLNHWYDGKYQEGIVIEVPIESPDDFYITSKSLFRFLTKESKADIRNSRRYFSINFSDVGPFIFTQMSADEKKMYIQFNHGGY